MKINTGNVDSYSPLCDTNIGKLSSARHLHHLVVIGENDSPAFKEQGKRFCAKLQSNKINAFLHHQSLEDHFSLVEKLKDEKYELSIRIIKFMGELKSKN